MLEYYLDGTTREEAPPPNDRRKLLPFQLQLIGHFSMGKKYFTRRDGGNNYLLVVTLSGCGRFSRPGQTCVLGPGQAILIDCREYQEYRTESETAWVFDYFHFDALSLEGYREALLKALTPVSLRSPAAVKDGFQALFRVLAEDTAAADPIMSHQISAILTEMVCSLADGPQPLHRQTIRDLAEYIRGHFTEDLHLDDFIRRTHLSRYYLIRAFERQMGATPYRYLHLCRIGSAQKLLTTTDRSVEEIAYAVGYRSSTVFCRHFRNVHSLSPAAYRASSVRFF